MQRNDSWPLTCPLTSRNNPHRVCAGKRRRQQTRHQVSPTIILRLYIRLYLQLHFASTISASSCISLCSVNCLCFGEAFMQLAAVTGGVRRTLELPRQESTPLSGPPGELAWRTCRSCPYTSSPAATDHSSPAAHLTPSPPCHLRFVGRASGRSRNSRGTVTLGGGRSR